MSPVREKFVNIIETLPYNIDEEIFKRTTMDILKEVVQKYVNIYGIDDLSESDKECIRLLIENENIWRKEEMLWIQIKKTFQ